jgi:sialate O-acetylesterase
MKKIPLSLLVTLLLAAAPGARAEVKLPAIFADHMVLQREARVSVWGTADPGEGVAVSFAGGEKRTVADAGGKWEVALDPLPASAEGRALTIRGKNSIRIDDVLVGEVWICSGQSNMEFALGRCTGGPEAVAASANPNYRLCTIPHNSQMTPQEDVAAKWAVSGPETTRFFSAIGWWFGSKLQKELGVPVGIINDSFGGTTIQSWMPIETLRKGPWPQDQSTDVALAKAAYDQRKAAMQPAMDKYLADKAAAIKAGTTPPQFPAGWPGDFRGPGVLWNGMVAPILKYQVRGVAWYQGESNAYVRAADTYAALLPALIADWRAGFAQPELPFIVFEIAPNRKPQTDPNEASGIAEVQEAQLKTVEKTPHAALVVTMDLGVPDVHYKNKEPAAERAVKAALALAYGRKVEASGPVLGSMAIAGGAATLKFTHTGGGLVAKDGPPSGFVIAGADKKFVFADAKIEGESVVVSSPQVPNPVAVRYGWADLPKVNLFGKNGLPASSFRTDDWPLP